MFLMKSAATLPFTSEIRASTSYVLSNLRSFFAVYLRAAEVILLVQLSATAS